MFWMEKGKLVADRRKMENHDGQREKGKPMTNRLKRGNLWQAEGKVKSHGKQREK